MLTRHHAIDAVPDDLVIERSGDLVMSSTAVFTRNKTHRLLLTRRWGDGPPLVFCMLNPSDADANADDQTSKKCQHFTTRAGHRAYVIVNLFGLVSTDPAALATHADPVGPGTDAYLVSNTITGGPVIVAWGAHRFARRRAADVTTMLLAHRARLYCLGTTADGSPRHPCRIAYDTPLIPYRPKAAGRRE